MAKLNWKRQNGGYELEPWQKSYKRKDDTHRIKSSHEILPSGLHQHHNLTKCTSVKNGYVKHLIWCESCGHQVKFITESDYNILDIPKRNTRFVVDNILKYDIMPFGKYKGRSVHELPETYLKWAIQNFNGHVAGQLALEWQRRHPEYK